MTPPPTEAPRPTEAPARNPDRESKASTASGADVEERDAPTSAAIAAITRTSDVPAGSIVRAADVDDALAADIAVAFSRGGHMQLVGMVLIFAGFFAATLLPPPAGLVAVIGLLPAILVGNFLADRASVNEMVQLGLSRPLARRLMAKTYSVPEAYTALPHTLSSSPASKQRIVGVIKKALAKC